jgi:hypothetical protein
MMMMMMTRIVHSRHHEHLNHEFLCHNFERDFVQNKQIENGTKVIFMRARNDDPRGTPAVTATDNL